MTEQTKTSLPVPPWLGAPPKEWPAAARTAFDILAKGAERRLTAEAALTPSLPEAEEKAA